MTGSRVGTRGSALALAQARAVATTWSEATGRQVDLVPVATQGDVDPGALTALGGQGVFVGALRQSLLAGDIDVAVHSLKDLPTTPADGIALAAVPAREDPRDVLVTRDGRMLAELSPGTTVGTGAPRRAAQLRALGLDLRVEPIRGNVDTRLRLVREGRVDAVVLARAGLARLDRLDEVSEVLDPVQMLPAPGQGALAAECRDDNGDLLAELAEVLDDQPSRLAVTAERALLAELGVGCAAPVGALAEVALGDDGEEIWLRAAVVAVDGSRAVKLSTTGTPGDPVGVARRLADRMREGGADVLIEERVA